MRSSPCEQGNAHFHNGDSGTESSSLPGPCSHVRNFPLLAYISKFLFLFSNSQHKLLVPVRQTSILVGCCIIAICHPHIFISLEVDPPPTLPSHTSFTFFLPSSCADLKALPPHGVWFLFLLQHLFCIATIYFLLHFTMRVGLINVFLLFWSPAASTVPGT